MDPAPPGPDRPSGPQGGVWRRFRRNAGMILGGRAAFGLVNLAAAALAVRAVGIEAFGVVILLQAYVRLIAGLLKFQSWAAVTGFGATALAEGRTEDFRRLIGFTLRLDLVGLGLSVGLGLALAPLAGRWLGWPPEAVALAPFMVLTIPFITAASPTGVLRLFDRFGVMVRQHGLNAVIRLIGAAGVWALGGGLTELIVTWVLASLLSGVQLMWAAAGELRRRGLTPRFRGGWGALSAGFPRIWRFVLVLKSTSTLDTLITHAAVLVVSAMLGTGAAGLFGLVRQMTEALSRLSSLLGPILFPEVAWMEARGDRRAIARLLWRSLALGGAALGAVCAVLVVAGEALLTALFGAEAAPAAPLLAVTGAASALLALGFAVEPVMLALRRERALLWSAVISTLVFCGALWGLLAWLGLIGVGFALLLRHGMVFVWRLAVVRRALAREGGRG